MEGYEIFFTRPASLILLILSILSLGLPFVQAHREKRKARVPGN
jgi:TctA family transporter